MAAALQADRIAFADLPMEALPRIFSYWCPLGRCPLGHCLRRASMSCNRAYHSWCDEWVYDPPGFWAHPPLAIDAEGVPPTSASTTPDACPCGCVWGLGDSHESIAAPAHDGAIWCTCRGCGPTYVFGRQCQCLVFHPARRCGPCGPIEVAPGQPGDVATQATGTESVADLEATAAVTFLQRQRSPAPRGGHQVIPTRPRRNGY
jgi:hypothetical protein